MSVKMDLPALQTSPCRHETSGQQCRQRDTVKTASATQSLWRNQKKKKERQNTNLPIDPRQAGQTRNWISYPPPNLHSRWKPAWMADFAKLNIAYHVQELFFYRCKLHKFVNIITHFARPSPQPNATQVYPILASVAPNMSGRLQPGSARTRWGS